MRDYWTQDAIYRSRVGGADMIRIVRGAPTDAEVAALVAVLAAASGGPAVPPARRERWGSPAELLRGPLHPGPGAWAASLRQR